MVFITDTAATYAGTARNRRSLPFQRLATALLAAMANGTATISVAITPRSWIDGSRGNAESPLKCDEKSKIEGSG